jgi:GNAT superfamily N-acetyltransferase
MNISNLSIRPLQYSDRPVLQNLPPEEWNFDLPQFLLLHFGQTYFYPIVAELDHRIVGFGNGIINRTTGWLGNIIVLPEFQKQGIGYRITHHLMEYFKDQGCSSQLLIATKAGEGLYRKLGFKISSMYLFFHKDGIDQPRPYNSTNIRMIKEEDYPLIRKLDQEISGEVRHRLIEQFLPTGWVYSSASSEEVEGFYLPNFGNGLIIAKEDEAGLALLEFKISLGISTIVVPSANTAARDVLIHHGFTEAMTVPRMVFGEELNWKPDKVYSRAAGYCG